MNVGVGPEDVTTSGLRPETAQRLSARQRGAGGAANHAIVLGDSIAYGWGLDYTEAFPARLEGLLTDHGGGGWQVVNAGIPGDTVMAGCLRYDRDVAPFAPQIVLIGFGLNDAALRRTCIDAERERQWLARRRLWMRACYVLRRWGAWPSLPEGEIVREEQPRVRPRLFRAGLRWLIKQVHASGARPMLMTMPPTDVRGFTSAQTQSYRAYDDLIRQAALHGDAEIVDLERSASRFCPRSMHTRDGIHLTAAGQRWLAQAVFEQVIAYRRNR